MSSVGRGLHEALRDARLFVHLFLEKVEDDDTFFIASALAWGVLFAIVPALVLAIGLSGFVLSARFADPMDAVVSLFAGVLPEGGAELDFAGLLSTLVGEVMVNRAGLTLVGAIVFVWFASRVSASLRSVLYQVFEVGVRRGIVHGKLFDMVAVLVGVVLITVDLGITVRMTSAFALGVSVLGWGGGAASFAEHLLAVTISFASSWVLFVIVYRYVPARRTPWRTVLIAATFTGLVQEALRQAFSWYLIEVAIYTSALGNLATVAVLLLWIYYGALVFIVGGEVAYVHARWQALRLELHHQAEGARRRSESRSSHPESATTGTR